MGRAPNILSVAVVCALVVASAHLALADKCDGVMCTGNAEFQCNLLKGCCEFTQSYGCKVLEEGPLPEVAGPVPDAGNEPVDINSVEPTGASGPLVIYGGGKWAREMADKVTAKLAGAEAGAETPLCPNPAVDGTKNNQADMWGKFSVAFQEFDDHNPDLLMDVAKIQDRDVVFIADMADTNNYFSMLSAMYTLQSIPFPKQNLKDATAENYEYRSPKSLMIVVPYLPVARMERANKWHYNPDTKPSGEVIGREHSEQSTVVDVATARTMAGLLSARPPIRVPTRLLFLDIHEYKEMARFLDESQAWDNQWSGEEAMDKTTGKGKYFASVVPSFIKANAELLADHVITFPDHGAYERFNLMTAFDGHRAKGLLGYCDKHRVVDKVDVVWKEESPVTAHGGIAGKDAIIFDDFTSSGGTLIQAAAALHKAGARSASIFVIHPLFANEGYKDFLGNKAMWKKKAPGMPMEFVDRIWVSDSIPKNAHAALAFADAPENESPFRGKFGIVPCSEAIAEWVSEHLGGNDDDDEQDAYFADPNAVPADGEASGTVGAAGHTEDLPVTARPVADAADPGRADEVEANGDGAGAGAEADEASAPPAEVAGADGGASEATDAKVDAGAAGGGADLSGLGATDVEPGAEQDEADRDAQQDAAVRREAEASSADLGEAVLHGTGKFRGTEY